MKIAKIGALIPMLLMSLVVEAGVMTYRVDANGYVQDVDQNRRNYAGYDNNTMHLYDATNQIWLGGSWKELQTSLFNVSDITDVTFAAQTYAKVFVGDTQYRINSDGNVVFVDQNRRDYAGYDNNTMHLNDATNQIWLGGSWKELQTSLFDVSDITDVTFAAQTYAKVFVGDTQYRINSDGNVVFVDQNRRDYAGYDNNTMHLNDATNQVWLGGAWKYLQTSLFDVSDIIDVTYAARGYGFVTVEVPDVEVDEPSTFALLGLGILALGIVRRTKANNH